MADVQRCAWAGNDGLMQVYHDEEWGVPVYDDAALFERLMSECFQAGLSWRTILHKRENFRRAFDNFDAVKMAAYDGAKIQALLQDAGIVRNRLKVRGAVQNAQAYLRLRAQAGPFSDWLWGFVGGTPLVPAQPPTMQSLPAFTAEATALSKALKKAGFTFVGPTVCYAFMQSAGLVNDHVAGCYRLDG